MVTLKMLLILLGFRISINVYGLAQIQDFIKEGPASEAESY